MFLFEFRLEYAKYPSEIISMRVVATGVSNLFYSERVMLNARTRGSITVAASTVGITTQMARSDPETQSHSLAEHWTRHRYRSYMTDAHCPEEKAAVMSSAGTTFLLRTSGSDLCFAHLEGLTL